MPKTRSDDVERLYRSRARSIGPISSHVGPNEAPDLEHDAYLKLIEAQRTRDIEAPGSFLYRIARNLVIDRFRRRKISEALFEPTELSNGHAADDIDEERRLIAADRLRHVLGLIDAMPSRRREVFIAHRLDGLSYARIASSMGISIKTVEKHISSAMAHLADEMAER